MAPILPTAAEGVKVTAITQFVPGWRAALTQVSVSEKSPLAVMFEMASGVVPLFVTVTLWGLLEVPTSWTPNARLEVESVTVEVLPVKFTTWGLPGALSVITTDAFRIPDAVGVKDTVIVQVAPTAKEGPQVVVSVKSLAFAPEMAMLEMVCGVSPFVTVTVCEALLVLRLCAA